MYLFLSNQSNFMSRLARMMFIFLNKNTAQIVVRKMERTAYSMTAKKEGCKVLFAIQLSMSCSAKKGKMYLVHFIAL